MAGVRPAPGIGRHGRANCVSMAASIRRDRGGGQTVRDMLGRILCYFGVHDFDVVDVTFGFGAGGSVAKMQCKRCGFVTTRHT